MFVNYDKDAIEFEEEKENQTEEQSELKRLLAMSVNEIELSVPRQLPQQCQYYQRRPTGHQVQADMLSTVTSVKVPERD